MANDALFNDWLVKQYKGEATAHRRILQFAELYATDERHKKTLNVIARQEKQHSEWVKDLLESRDLNTVT